MMQQGELTYFLKCHGFVKIGRTTTLKSRVDLLQTGNPYELELIGVAFESETDIQAKFEPLNERGEWYHLTAELKRYISDHAACPDKEGNIQEPQPKPAAARIMSIREIVEELTLESGSAHIDSIIKQASKLGYGKAEVEAEVTRLVSEAAMFEPVRYSRNYRLTQQ